MRCEHPKNNFPKWIQNIRGLSLVCSKCFKTGLYKINAPITDEKPSKTKMAAAKKYNANERRLAAITSKHTSDEEV
jgi:hypothetical protein